MRVEFFFTVWNSILSGNKWRNFKMIIKFELRTFHALGGGVALSTWEVLVDV